MLQWTSMVNMMQRGSTHHINVDVKATRDAALGLENRPLSAALWLSTQNAQNFSMKNCVHAGDQGIWLKSVRFEVSRFLCHNFSSTTKEKIGSWNPQWQTTRHGCITSLLKQKKLECKKSNKLLEPKISMCVNLLQESWHLSQDTCWFQDLGEQQSMRLLATTLCNNCVRLLSQTDQDMSCEAKYLCTTTQPKTARVTAKLLGHPSYSVTFTHQNISFTWVVQATLQK
jgi:hypothetical protein